jgi:hypothetical protein
VSRGWLDGSGGRGLGRVVVPVADVMARPVHVAGGLTRHGGAPVVVLGGGVGSRWPDRSGI